MIYILKNLWSEGSGPRGPSQHLWDNAYCKAVTELQKSEPNSIGPSKNAALEKQKLVLISKTSNDN